MARAHAAWILVATLVACAPDLTPSSEVAVPRIMATRIEVAGEGCAPDPECAHDADGACEVRRTCSASPDFGDTAVLRMQVAFPEAPPVPPSLDLRMAFCISEVLPGAARYCLQELPAELLGASLEQVGPQELQLTYSLPDEESLLEGADPELIAALEEFEGAIPDLVLFGGLCVEGKAERRDADVNEVPLTELFTCEGEDDTSYPHVITFTKTLFTPGGPENLNPELACDDEDVASCDGAPQRDEAGVVGTIALVRPLPEDAPDDADRKLEVWPEERPGVAGAERVSFEDCDRWAPIREDGEPDPYFRVRVGEDPYHIRVRFKPADRQRLEEPQPPPDIPDREELFVYAALTEDGGSLDSFLKLIEAHTDDDALEVEFEYEPPDSNEAVEIDEDFADSDGRVVRFYFLVRDGRGGRAFTTRALCLLP